MPGTFKVPGKHVFSKKHSFKDMSTRKHYPGEHHIALIMNGVEKAKVSLELVARLLIREANR